MATWAAGNIPIYSTGAGLANNPSTATLVAEVDSTQLGTVDYASGQHGLFRVTWILASDTNATWQCESATSTALNAGKEIIWPKTGTSVGAQFVTLNRLGKDDRLRARIGGSTFTAQVSATIIAEALV